MDDFTQMLINIDSKKYTLSQMVSILILIVSKLNINTISGMARSENKTPRGITISNRYKKINIGVQTFAIKGIINDGLPF